MTTLRNAIALIWKFTDRQNRILTGAVALALAAVIAGWPAPLWLLRGPLKEWPQAAAWDEWYAAGVDSFFGVDRTGRFAVVLIYEYICKPIAFLLLVGGVMNLFPRRDKAGKA